MARKISQESFNSLIRFCNFEGEQGLYVQKQGTDYVSVLREIYGSMNANDIPFTIEDVVRCPTLEDFKFEGKNDFKFVCRLHAEPLTITTDRFKNNERIIASDWANKYAIKLFNEKLGVAYMITCPYKGKEHVIKFGQTRTPFKDRLQSYNCGTMTNWRTASTTNIKMLQSMVTTRTYFNLYLYDCTTIFEMTWHGVKSAKFSNPEALAVEDIMTRKFREQFGTLPLANIQANPSKVDQFI